MSYTEEMREELADEQKEQQEQERKIGFNFAAFIMPHIWGLCNGVYMGLLALFPIAAPFVSLYLGFRGTKLAYEKSDGRQEEFYKKQRRWQFVAVVYLIAVIAMIVGFMYDDIKNYFAQNAERNRLIEKTLDEKEELRRKIEILTSEECLNDYWDGVIAEPLLDMEFYESDMWEVQKYSDLEEPVILYVEQCFGFEDGRILWLHYSIEDNSRIVEGIYYIVPSEEVTSLPLEQSLDARFFIEWGTFMEESDICEVLGIPYTPDETDVEQTEEVEEISDVSESVEEEAELYLPDEDGYYILNSDDSLKSVKLIQPDGFEVHEFSDEEWLYFTDWEIENGITNISAWIEKNDAEGEKESMMSQVDFTFAFNNFSSQEIGEVQQKEVGEYEISYFRYSYIRIEDRIDEGYRVWAPIGDGYFLCLSIEKANTNVNKIDIDSYLETLFSNMKPYEETLEEK